MSKNKVWIQPESWIVCPDCGSRDRFIEVMESEAHLVDGNGTYIELIEGVTDHYICYACGESFELEEEG